MGREKEKKDANERCNSCDQQKLKRMENNPAIRELRDKIERLNFRLTECRNENQMLKRNLLLAKKIVYQEVGGHDKDFQTLMKQGTESGWKGRLENVLVLKKKVQELKTYLRELEGDPPSPHESPSEEFARQQIPGDRKMFWRMELERRLARESAEKDMNPLVQECAELRKTLDFEKSRFRELNDEVKLLRAELHSQVEKNEEDIGIVNSFHTIEKQLEDTLAERAEIRQELDGSRSRNKRLSDEINILKDELQVLYNKAKDNNSLIETLTSKHKHIQEAIDAEKLIVQQNIDRYKEELKNLQDNYRDDVRILDHLQYIIYERSNIIQGLQNDITGSLMSYVKEEKKPEDIKEAETEDTSEASESSVALSPKSKKEDENITDDAKKEIPAEIPSEIQLKIQQLRIDCAKYKALFKAAQVESERLVYITSLQDERMHQIATQVVETGRLTMLKNAEKKELLEKVTKLQRALSAKRKKGKAQVQPKNRLEELKIKTEAQREENEFLRNLLSNAVCSKAKDLDFYRDFIAETKNNFVSALQEIKALLIDEVQEEPQSVQEPEEVSNQDNT